MKNFLNRIYNLRKTLEFKTTSIFGALIVLTVFLVIILSNIAQVQSGSTTGEPGAVSPLEQRSPTGTVETEQH